jgi:tetratricopeptide (TPR) repeat protein
VNEGDMSGIQDIERSIEIALAANSAECVRGYTNLSATLLAGLGDIERGIEADAEGIRAAERFGDEIGLRFLRGHQMISALITGRWDESLAIADEFIAAGEAGSPHYMECAARHHRAAILLARDHSEEALAQAGASIELARRIRDPQALQPALVICANVFYQAGEIQVAEAFVVEFLDSWRRTLVFIEYLHHSISCVLELGHGDRLSSLLRGAVASPWRDAAEAALSGDPVRDAEILAGAGAHTYEAAARLRAGKQLVEQGRRAEADDQLRRSLAFYRSVGATRYIREGEALLAVHAQSESA